jgi:hypothetical protein
MDMNCEDEPKSDRPPPYDPPPGDPRPGPPPPPHEKEVDGDHRCKRLAAEVNKQLHEQSHLQNKMAPHDGPYQEFKSEPLDIPRIEPWVSISWGDSKCDCIESDDTEIMYLTVCNPYSNLTLSQVTVQEVRVVDESGKAVPKLPNGDPCIELVPVGPYFFDDIPPGSCVSRQFLMRLRGALGGRHRILLRGICFDACVHGDNDGGFNFDVCKD